jgi:hypothetical protein
LWKSEESQARFRGWIRDALILAAPFFLARFLYTFLFLRVFQWHDYYAIPINALGALSAGILLGWTVTKVTSEIQKLPARDGKAAWLWLVLAAISVPVIAASAAVIRADRAFTAGRSDPSSPRYCTECLQKIFPDDAKMVVVVNPGNVTDLRYLYYSKRPGFTWCLSNREFAPRKFWKDAGVTHVAWPHPDPNRQGAWLWTVIPLDQELAEARAKGWSSDVLDPWEGRSMAEWASIASQRRWEICNFPSLYDPRTWPQN